MKGYMFLFISILFEIIGSSMLKLSAGFTNVIPSLIVVVSYGLSFTIFIFALKTISLSMGYSIWAGLGTAGTGLIGVIFFNEVLSGINILGLLVIIGGVVIMNMAKTPEATEESHSI